MLHCLPPTVLLIQYYTCMYIWENKCMCMLVQVYGDCIYIYIHMMVICTCTCVYLHRSYLSCSFLWKSLVICEIPSGACVNVSILCAVLCLRNSLYMHITVFLSAYIYKQFIEPTYILHVMNVPVKCSFVHLYMCEHCSCLHKVL